MSDPSGAYYRAFISYSHQDNRIDRRDGSRGRMPWADWLHEALESFEVPGDVEPTFVTLGPERRLHPVFKDEDELPVSPDLGGSIEDALRASDALIVICSPRCAASLYCNEEIRLFKAMGRGDRILPLIVAGEPGASGRQLGAFEASEECFAPALRFRVDESGALLEGVMDHEPICADARDAADGRELSAEEWRLDRDAQQRVLLKLVAGLLGVSFDALVQRDRKRQMEQERARARSSAARLYVSALREFDRGSATDAAAYLAAALRTHAEPTAPRFAAMALLDGRGATDLGGTIRAQGAPVLCCAVNSGFTRVAYGTLDGRVGIAALPGGASNSEFALPASSGPVCSIAWGGDDDHLSVVSWGGDVFTFDARRLAWEEAEPALGPPRHYESLPEAVLDPQGPGTDFAGTDHAIWSDFAQLPAWRGQRYRASVQVFALHPQADWFVAVMRDGVHMFDCRTFERLTDQPLFEVASEQCRITALTVDPTGARIAVVSSDGRLGVVDVVARHRDQVQLGGDWGQDEPLSITFDASGRVVFVGTRDGMGMSLDASGLTTFAARRIHLGPVTLARCDPSRARVVTGCEDGTVGAWHLPRLETAGDLTSHERGVADLIPDPDGRRVVTAGYDGSLRLVRWLGARECFSEPFRVGARALALGPELIAFAMRTGAITLTTHAGEHVRDVAFDGVGEIGWAAFMNDGQQLLVSAYELFKDSAGVIHNSRTTWRFYRLELASGRTQELSDFQSWRHAASSRGDRVVRAADEHALEVLDVSAGSIQPIDFVAPERITGVFADDAGSRALVAFGQGEARLVDLETGTLVCDVPEQLHPVGAAAFHGAPSILAIGAEEVVSILDAASGERITPPIMTGSENIEALAFSPDGELLFVGGWGFAAIYDARAGLPVGPPLDLGLLELSIVRAARFSPNGELLVLSAERLGGSSCVVGLAVPATSDVDGPALADLLEVAYGRSLNTSGVSAELRDGEGHLARLADAVEARHGSDTAVSRLLERYYPRDKS